MHVSPSELMELMRTAHAQGVQDGRLAGLREAHAVVNALIPEGQLDADAVIGGKERNGLVMAANAISSQIF
jgi:hypothetical protein